MRSLRIAAFSLLTSLGVATTARAETPQPPAHPCAQDAERLCQGVPVGGGAQMACLKAHKDQLSPECKINILKAAEKHEEQTLQQPPATP